MRPGTGARRGARGAMAEPKQGGARGSGPGWNVLAGAFGHRKTATTLAFGFAAGLPFAMLIGTLNAWLGEAGVDLATIGVLSWIGLAYAFKFLWSPAVDRLELPVLGRLGRRRGWIVGCQLLIAASLAAIASIDPLTNLGRFAVAAVFGAFAAATQDVVIDAWRIEAADDETPLDLLSALYQFGYRTASLVGGAGALVLAQRTSWPAVYGAMALLMGLAIVAAFRAPEPAHARVDRGAAAALGGLSGVAPRWRNAGLLAVLLAWGWAIASLGSFMVSVVAPDAGATERPSARAFMTGTGPFIVLATVILPALVAGGLDGLRRRGNGLAPLPGAAPAAALQRALDHLAGAILGPLAELIGRLRLAAVLVLVLILSYRLTDSIWGPFAFPFYLGTLHYSHDEVAFASKVFGVGMTIAGVALAGGFLLRFGRMATLTLGAVVAAASNLLYYDLALGGPRIDALLAATRLHDLLAFFGVDDRMGRLLVAISGENVAGGFAGAAFVAYLSSVASREYSAVQYALLSSLTLLIGSLGRGPLGEAIDVEGYPPVFLFTTALGGIGVAACLLEWLRTRGAAAGGGDAARYASPS